MSYIPTAKQVAARKRWGYVQHRKHRQFKKDQRKLIDNVHKKQK